MAPRIDVLLSAYNAASTIRDAINSIRAQTVSDFRLIVVDDGSTDGTAEILADIAATEPRLMIVTQPNRGITEALNHGLQYCSAEFLARHDADDLSEPDRFEKELAYLDAHPDCLAVSGEAWHVDEYGIRLGATGAHDSPDLADPDWIPAREPHVMQPFLMVRRESVVAAGGYRPLRVAEDSDLYWRLQERGRLYNMPVVLGSYRIHANSVSSGSARSGRIIALCSQLAALSARRRRSGRPDLVFSLSDADAYADAQTLQDFHAIGCTQLDAEERRRLQLCMAAKLVEVSFYRPFEPDQQDCRFIRQAIEQHGDLLSAENHAALSEAVMKTAVRLGAKGRIGDALALLPRQRRAALFARLAFRLGIPDGLRDRIKGVLGRGRPVGHAAAGSA